MAPAPFVLVAGGYGFFGARIATWLASDANSRILVGGRDAARCEDAARQLRAQAARGAAVHAYPIDVLAPDAAERLRASGAGLLIHTAGPFQGQDYRVPRACIDAGVDCIDLADAREYVTGIGSLDAAARGAGVAIVSGASTVPAISCAMADDLALGMARVEGIEIGISVGNRTQRGLATVEAVLGYCGRAIAVKRDGKTRIVHGWQDPRRHRYPAPVGMRWMSACDVPDLELLPARFPSARDVAFRAGLELPLLQASLWALAWLVRAGMVRDVTRHALVLSRGADALRGFGSDAGAMHVTLSGACLEGRHVARTWTLIARDGKGPQVPCTPSVILARRWRSGKRPAPGATPCVGMIARSEVEAAWSALPFTIHCATLDA